MSGILLLLLTIPVITALIGWVTNWAAVKMIFHPERFVGIGPIGWQAILTRRSHKFATGVADMAADNLISAREIAQRLDPAEMEKLFAETLDSETERVCKEAADVIQPGAWDELPEPARAMIVAQVRADNIPSQRAFEKSGFTREGIEAINGVRAFVFSRETAETE